MRFRFCGDLDCPDWVLAEIFTLSKMSSVKVKMLCQIVAKSLTGYELDGDFSLYFAHNGIDLEDWKKGFRTGFVEGKGIGCQNQNFLISHPEDLLLGNLVSFCPKEEKAKKLVLDAKLDLGDMKACIAALSLIFESSARYAVEEDVLNSELQQLGLPKEHATGLCKVYSEHLTALTEDLKKRSMRTSILEDVSCSIRDLGAQNVELKLRVSDKIRNVTSSDEIIMTTEQLALLLADLKSVREEMKILPG